MPIPSSPARAFGGGSDSNSTQLPGDRVWIEDGPLLVRLARDEAEVQAAQLLRHQVFTLELGEGLEGARELGIDVDAFDPQCDHLLLIDRGVGVVVGTYRLQTLERSTAGVGFYCDQEFRLSDLGHEVLAAGVELGRACVLASHRNGSGLLALWRGIIAYAISHEKRWLFGCCSLTGTDPTLARLAESWLTAAGHRREDVDVAVRAGYAATEIQVEPAAAAAFRPPRLFSSYLRYGTRVCSGPAIDREFGTIDFLVLFDLDALEPRLRRLLIEA
jgi:putative hemolysin